MIDIASKRLVEKLDSLVADGPPVLAFDADGTLWQGDVGDDFFDALIAGGLVLPSAQAAMARELGIAGGEGDRPEQALFDAYHSGKFDEERFYECVAWAAAGRDRGAVLEVARRVQAERKLPERLHAEIRPVLAWARARGAEVYVVSASPRLVVQEGARLLGLEPARVLGAEAVFEGERMMPAALRPIPYGAGKVVALRKHIGARPLLAAFGDNVFDVPMMKEAQLAVAVRPKPRLLAVKSEVPGLFGLEPTM